MFSLTLVLFLLVWHCLYSLLKWSPPHSRPLKAEAKYQYGCVTTLISTCHDVTLPSVNVLSSLLSHHPSSPIQPFSFVTFPSDPWTCPVLPHLFPLLKVFCLPESHSPTLASLVKFHSRSAFKSPVTTWFRQSFLLVSSTLSSYCCWNIHLSLYFSDLLVCLSSSGLLASPDEGLCHAWHLYILDVWRSVWGSCLLDKWLNYNH